MDMPTDNPVIAMIWWVFTQLAEDPNLIQKAITIAVAGVVVRLILFIFQAIQTSLRKKWRESYARGFSSEQRVQGFARAGGRCEFDSGWGRCSNRAEHADHFYPWSRGGATSMPNLVAACSSHNLSKGAKMPSAILRSRIEARRKSYFPRGVPVTAGEWSKRADSSVVNAARTA